MDRAFKNMAASRFIRGWRLRIDTASATAVWVHDGGTEALDYARAVAIASALADDLDVTTESGLYEYYLADD